MAAEIQSVVCLVWPSSGAADNNSQTRGGGGVEWRD